MHAGQGDAEERARRPGFLLLNLLLLARNASGQRFGGHGEEDPGDGECEDAYTDPEKTVPEEHACPGWREGILLDDRPIARDAVDEQHSERIEDRGPEAIEAPCLNDRD